MLRAAFLMIVVLRLLAASLATSSEHLYEAVNGPVLEPLRLVVRDAAHRCPVVGDAEYSAVQRFSRLGTRGVAVLREQLGDGDGGRDGEVRREGSGHAHSESPSAARDHEEAFWVPSGRA